MTTQGNFEKTTEESKANATVNPVVINEEQASCSSSGTSTETNPIQDKEVLQAKEQPKHAGSKAPSISGSFADSMGEVILRPHIERAIITPARMGPRKIHSTSDLQNYGKFQKKGNSFRRNDGMVLQLVLPSSNRSSQIYDTSDASVEDILGNGHLKERHKHPISIARSISSHQDFSPASINGHVNLGYSPFEKIDYSSRSPVTPGSSTHYGPDQPTHPEEKKQAFTDVLTRTLSLFYALFNVTLGLALYVSDIVDGSHSGSEIFSLVLVVPAFAYVLYLTLDISWYVRKKERYEKMLESSMTENIQIRETPEGHFHFNVVLPDSVKDSLKHSYCFSKDRHSQNFFLKVGAAAFCFGHLIHSGLLFGYQIVFLTSDNHQFYECASIPTLMLDILYPIYSFFLLFFIFKYSNVIINRNITLARFGIMHCLSSSLCFWIWTIFREILEAIASKEYKNEIEPYDQPYALPQSAYDLSGKFHDSIKEHWYKMTHYVLAIYTVCISGPQSLSQYVNMSARRFTEICEYEDDNIRTIYRDISPYLYPFSVEFSILIVGIWYLVWQNIGLCRSEEDADEASTTLCRNPENTESNVVVHADCQSSNKGLFGGFVVLVLTIISSILFFIAVYLTDGDQSELGVFVNIVTSLIILSSMTIACIFGYRQITKLDLNTAHHNLLDDFLLFICIPAYFLNGIFSIIPAIVYSNVLGAVNIVLEVCQVLLQTVFILDGVRRSSNTRQLRKKKPGRELVTFLVLSNIALWLLQTFEVKSHEAQDNRYDFYGKELWTILGHMCLPLLMFYRFHSSVCFGDIWKYAYEPSGH